MIVLCDADGVFIDFIGGLCHALHEHRVYKSPRDFAHWDLEHSLNAAEFALAELKMREPGFCERLPWYAGGASFLLDIRDVVYRRGAPPGDLHVLSAPYDSPTWERERRAEVAPYLQSRSHFLPVSGRFKHLVHGDVLVEDHPATLGRWLDAHPEGLGILFDRPWNREGAREFQLHGRMHRVASYAEAMTLIRERAQ